MNVLLFWNNTSLISCCFSSPAPGYFNDDDVLDFMIHFNVGFWPLYNHSLVKNDFLLSCELVEICVRIWLTHFHARIMNL